MGKTWVLDTETKGTGANVVPLEKATQQSEAKPATPSRKHHRARSTPASPPPRHKRAVEPRRTATALPPGHVRKRATGELGRVKAVDPKAGTATVQWLRSGSVSTVRLSALTRR